MNQKYHLYLTDYEYKRVIQSLIRLKKRPYQSRWIIDYLKTLIEY